MSTKGARVQLGDCSLTQTRSRHGFHEFLDKTNPVCVSRILFFTSPSIPESVHQRWSSKSFVCAYEKRRKMTQINISRHVFVWSLAVWQLLRQHVTTPPTTPGAQRGRGGTPSPQNVRQPASPPATTGNKNMSTEREGVPITSLAAFVVPENDYKDSNSSAQGLWDTSQAADCGSCVMVATGWEDGRWTVTPFFSFDEDHGGACALSEGGDDIVGSELEQVGGDTDALGPGAVLHMVHQVKTRHAFFFFELLFCGRICDRGRWGWGRGRGDAFRSRCSSRFFVFVRLFYFCYSCSC